MVIKLLNLFKKYLYYLWGVIYPALVPSMTLKCNTNKNIHFLKNLNKTRATFMFNCQSDGAFSQLKTKFIVLSNVLKIPNKLVLKVAKPLRAFLYN